MGYWGVSYVGVTWRAGGSDMYRCGYICHTYCCETVLSLNAHAQAFSPQHLPLAVLPLKFHGSKFL